MLESVISDVTGWQAHVVDFTQLLGTTQYMQNIRLNQGMTADIRDINGITTLGTPFEVNAHRINVHSTQRYPAKFNLNTVGLFIWRLVSYPIAGGFALAVPNQTDCYTFNPVGLNMQLFNNPQPITDLSQVATEINLPVAIRSAAFQQDLVNYQQLYGNLPDSAKPPNSEYYGPQQSLYIVAVDPNGNTTPVPPSNIVVADLSTWSATLTSAQVAVDVNLGRLVLGSSYLTNLDHVEVNYYYGFSAPMGGGHYDRQSTLAIADTTTFFVSIANASTPNPDTALQNAINEWVSSGLPNGIIEIEDDATYSQASLVINTTAVQQSLTIQAANNARPCLQLTSTIQINSDNNPLQVVLNGLLINGSIDLQAQTQLTIEHCTLVPSPQASLTCEPSSNDSSITISSSIMGAMYLSQDVVSLTISDSIIDAQQALNGIAIAGDSAAADPGPYTSIQRTTVFGSLNVIELALLSDSIVTQPVIVDRTQAGSVRFSSLPFTTSRTPPRYRCQPDLDFIPQAQQQASEEGLSDYTQLQTVDPDWWNLTLAALEPMFTSTTYGTPGYAQLDITASQSILVGASDGAEMGCFQSLDQPQRQSQLQSILNEYLPFGLTPQIFYVT